MKKQFLIISIAAILCVGGLSGCFEQNKQNNNTNPEDTVDPTTPTNVRCTSPKTDNTPTFSWNASTDTSSVAGYYVKIDTSEDIWVGNVLAWKSTRVIADGTHIFYVKAKDASTNGNNGTYGSCSFIVNTNTIEKPPVADANGPYSWFTNHSITFDGSKSYDLDGNIVNYTWNLGDGTILYGKIVTHSYNKAGVYNISLTVIDNDSLADTNTTIATIILYSESGGNPDNGNESGGSHPAQEKFIGSWHNVENEDEHWIFYENGTQKYTLVVTDNPPGEPYVAELWFDYTVNNSMLCQVAFSNYGGVPACYGYEFSENNTILSLFDNGMLMLRLMKD